MNNNSEVVEAVKQSAGYSWINSVETVGAVYDRTVFRCRKRAVTDRAYSSGHGLATPLKL